MLVLVICLLAVYLTRMGNDNGMESWSELVENLDKTMKSMEPSQNYASISTFLTIGPALYYCVVGADLISIIILFCIGILVLHKYNKYEAQE